LAIVRSPGQADQKKGVGIGLEFWGSGKEKVAKAISQEIDQD